MRFNGGVNLLFHNSGLRAEPKGYVGLQKKVETFFFLF
jgi:hypothetical protein